MSAKAAATKLLVARRAVRDLADIEDYSVARWGRPTADAYLADIEAALERLRLEPNLLRPEQGFHKHLSFYPVRKHLLVCDRQPTAIFLLAVVHGSRDIPSFLAELAPTLAAETELLARQLSQSRHH